MKYIEFYGKKIKTPRKANKDEAKDNYLDYLMNNLRENFPISPINEKDYDTREHYLTEVEHNITNYYGGLFKMALELSDKLNKEETKEEAKEIDKEELDHKVANADIGKKESKTEEKDYNKEIGEEELDDNIANSDLDKQEKSEKKEKVGLLKRIKNKFKKKNKKEKSEKKEKIGLFTKFKNKITKKDKKEEKKSKKTTRKPAKNKRQKLYTRQELEKIIRGEIKQEERARKARIAEIKENERKQKIIDSAMNDLKYGKTVINPDKKPQPVVSEESIKNAVKRYNDMSVLKTDKGVVIINAEEFYRLIDLEMELKREQMKLSTPRMKKVEFESQVSALEEQARKRDVIDTTLAGRQMIKEERYEELIQLEAKWKEYITKKGLYKEQQEQLTESFKNEIEKLLSNEQQTQEKPKQLVK